ncbi:hypothetical protein RHGRI_021642 [Rhododendron griersonianum]|uniref:Peptidase A1 domain-containing protein n=1 Tax=Rhododendron griersonianum TaxID=479676 RepID=A0AAV6JPZ0_9ERIC|nr:hypothetical protein RHGRI_021642 [Rhododendron griersonianum]
MDLTILSIFLFSSLLLTTTKALDPCVSPKSKSDHSDLSLIHIYGKCSPFNPPNPASSWVNTVLNMASKDPERVTYLSSLVAQKTTSVPIGPGQQIVNVGNYVVRAKIGTPGQLMFMVLDTSSNAAWVPCSGCTGCSSTVTYSDSSFAATLSRDSLTLAADVIPNYAFGCINSVSGGSIPPQGLLGLGRGTMSLLSQSGSLYSGVFSYCLPSFKSYYFSGSLKLGPTGQPKTIRTTPLLRNPRRPSLYYVNLTGVNVGRVHIPIVPGTVITRFVAPIYNATRDEFRNQVKGPFSSLGAFDTCFSPMNEDVAPAITLRFSGMDLVLPAENSLIHSSSGSLACLAMAAAPNNVNSVLNVIANLQQQNLRILFDTVNSRVGIARENCN